MRLAPEAFPHSFLKAEWERVYDLPTEPGTFIRATIRGAQPVLELVWAGPSGEEDACTFYMESGCLDLGDNLIPGGSGKDDITGGAGADRLTGGSGADLFVYTAAAQSSVASPDTILDFNPLEGDVLAFAGMGTGGSFRWRGSLAFTSQGGAEGRFDEVNKTLFVDLNGDGQADMAFLLPNFSSASFSAQSVVWA